MSTGSTPVCPQCGTPLPPNSPTGLCPRCLMAMNMATQTDVADPTGPHGTKIVPPPPPNAPTPEEIAKFFPQLEIIECLGRGGMGVVYKARQPRLNRLVALKILAPEREKDPAFSGRFEKEAQALARLSHPNIVTIHDFGQAGGMYYLLMEFVDGVTLRQLLNASRVSPREALAIVPQICNALQFAHDHGIVHRDIKPENILLDRLGRVKVADFGLAKLVGGNEPLTPSLSPSDGERVAKPGEGNPVLTEAGKVMGTPQYMAPEQTSHPAEVDHRADIYALGVVFYQMLTGELPGKRLEPPSKKVHIDVRLDEIVMRALEQKPALRYQQASMLKTQVETIVGTPEQSGRQHEASQSPTPFVPAAGFATLYFCLLGLLAWSAPMLPDRVACHFDGDGNANGWMSRRAYLLIIGTLPLFIAGLFTLVGWLGKTMPARFTNIPRRDYWLAPERRPLFSALLLRRLLWLAGLQTFFFGGLHWLTVAANRAVPPHLASGSVLGLTIGFLVLLMVWVVSLMMRLAEAGDCRVHATVPREPILPTPAPTKPLTRFQSIALTALSVLLAGLLLFIGWTANEGGIFFNALAVFIMLMVPIRIVLICWNLFYGSLEYRLWRKPLARELRRYWWQIGNGWIFWLLVGLTLELCIVPAQFTPQEYAVIRTIVWGGITILMLLALLPGKRIYVATNLAFAIGSIFMATQMARIYWPGPKTNGVILAAPFRGEWLVVNGGRSTLINIHYGHTNQRDALDLERIVDGQERTGDRKRWTSYPSWGETLYAPADGKIAKVVRDLDDNPLGQRDDEHLAGNHVVIDMGNGRFVMMAHLQKGSVLVTEGDAVRVGQPIAKCGNSGNTSHPHLHLQVQNKPDFSAPDLKTFPILFRDVTCLRAGSPRTDAPFFVRRNDRLVSEPITKTSGQNTNSINHETKP